MPAEISMMAVACSARVSILIFSFGSEYFAALDRMFTTHCASRTKSPCTQSGLELSALMEISCCFSRSSGSTVSAAWPITVADVDRTAVKLDELLHQCKTNAGVYLRAAGVMKADARYCS